MTTYKFSFPTLIHFGGGVRHQAGPWLAGRGLKRPLLVTDRGLAGLPMTAELASSLAQAGLQAAVFAGIGGNPVKSQVTEGVRAFRDHQADCLVGFGGGAALDVCKAMALMVKHPGDLFDYEDDKPGALPMREADIPTWIALPTTAGTGSEVGRSAVISDEATHVKKIIFGPCLLAKAVFTDPELTLNLPPKLTAATGFDALTHCLEAYLARGFHPICDGVALEGLKICGENLARAVSNPGDLVARSGMSMASMMGAIAFQKGLGVTHSCAHALSALKDLHHGLANALMIDQAMAFNVPASPERFRHMATTLGLSGGIEGFIPWLRDLKEATGIPQNLAKLGVLSGDIPRLAELAFQDSCHQSNPRPVTREDLEEIFTRAL